MLLLSTSRLHTECRTPSDNDHHPFSRLFSPFLTAPFLFLHPMPKSPPPSPPPWTSSSLRPHRAGVALPDYSAILPLLLPSSGPLLLSLLLDDSGYRHRWRWLGRQFALRIGSPGRGIGGRREGRTCWVVSGEWRLWVGLEGDDKWGNGKGWLVGWLGGWLGGGERGTGDGGNGHTRVWGM